MPEIQTERLLCQSGSKFLSPEWITKSEFLLFGMNSGSTHFTPFVKKTLIFFNYFKGAKLRSQAARQTREDAAAARNYLGCQKTPLT